MKICLISESFFPNVDGMSTFTQNLAQYLIESGNEVLVVCPTQRRKPQDYFHRGYEVYETPSIKEYFSEFKYMNPLSVLKLNRKIKFFNPDVVHFQTFYSPLSNILLKYQEYSSSRPIYVYTQHSLPLTVGSYFQPAKNLGKQMIDFLWSWCISFCEKMDIVVSPSEYGKSTLIENGLKTEIKVISNGVDLKQFKFRDKDMSAFNRLKIPKDKIILLTTGRLSEEKNHIEIIKTMMHLDSGKYHLVLVGKGKNQQFLKKFTKEHSLQHNVTFLGYLPSTKYRGIYNIADIYINMSDIELQGIVGLEALASGLPMIVSSKGAMQLLVEGNGYICHSDNNIGLSKKIEELGQDKALRQKFSRQSLKLAKIHEVDKCMQQYLDLYNTKTG
jgi:glycosyltransferase involved in cell wall biosynthesis